MRLEMLLPAGFGAPDAAQALAEGNCALACAVLSERLRDQALLPTSEVSELLCQAAVAAASCCDVETAARHVEQARLLAGATSEVTALTVLLGAAISCLPPIAPAKLAHARQQLATYVRSQGSTRDGIPRDAAELVAARCDLLLGDLSAASHRLRGLQGDLGMRPLWVEAEVLVLAATLAVLDGDAIQAAAAIAMAKPVAVALGVSPSAAATWWELADIAHAIGQHDDAQAAATNALDCSGVRPADGNGTFAPGVLMWAAGL